MQRTRRSLMRPLVVASFAGPIVLSLIIAIAQSWQQTDHLRFVAEQRLESVTRMAAAVDPADVAQLAEKSGVRIVLINDSDDGKIIADSHSEEPMPDISTARDIYLARNFGSGSATITVSGMSMTWRAQKLDQKHGRLLLRVGVPTFGVDELTRRPLVTPAGALLRAGWFWALTAAFSTISAIIALFVTRRIRQPLERLTEALRRLPQITGQQQVQVAARGEFEELGDAFNEAVDELNQQFQTQQARTAELEENARFLDTVLGSMIEGVVVVDDVHRVVYSNPAAAVLLGFAQKMTGRQLLEIIRHQSIDQSVRAVLTSTDRSRCELELPRTQRLISVLTSRLPGTPPRGAVLVIHDVTELRRLETMRRDFVSSASHELKTPLAGIQAFVETLLNGAMEDAPTCERFLQRISEQAERLNTLIQDMLQLARIESGRESFNITRISVEESIQRCLEVLLPVASQQGLQLHVIAPEEDIIVLADAHGLRTILENLIGNALKYTPAGGEITVKWWVSGTQARIDVSDTGVGIPREHLPRIFERFYRVDEARARDAGGTGLGLSIVKHLTQVFGGRVTVESQAGKGSTFSVYLPLASQAK